MIDQVPTEWYCIDNYLPEPDRDGSESSLIESKEQLFELLEDYAQKDARILIFLNPNGGRAFVGIGGDLGGVSYYPIPNKNYCLTATPNEKYTERIHDFRAVGEWTPFEPEFLMPVGHVIQIILDLYRTGECPNWISWKQTGA